MSDTALWYVSRGTGVATLLLLTLVVALGVITRRGVAPGWMPKFVVAGVHRNASLMALVLLAIHVVTIVSDTYAHVGWLATVVPFVSNFRPLWVGLGAIAMELFVAVSATSLVRHALGRRSWRAIHLTVYAAWPFAVAHGLGTGRDVGQPWMVAVTVASIAVAGAAVAYRLYGMPRPVGASA